MELKQHALYVVYFADQRVKVGITRDVRARMAYYRQEAVRNRVPSVHWWAAAPFQDKGTALLAERLICRSFKQCSMPGHREWFNGDLGDYKAIMAAAERIRAELAHECAAVVPDLPFMARHGHYTGLAA